MPPVERLVQDLQGPKPRARAKARQLLPHRGVDAVGPMLDLLTHADPFVAQAAFDVLMDVANAACAPGFDDRRKSVTEHVLALLEPNRSQREKELALRVLARVAPPGVDLASFTPLLRAEPRVRDKARVALQRMGTPEAMNLLRKVLDEAGPTFQCSLLLSLGELRDAESLPAIRRLAGSPEPASRAAVAGTLAWAADPADADTYKAIAAKTDAETRRDVLDAWLRFAEALAQQPDHHDDAQQVYLDILSVTESDEKLGPIAGLGQIADAACIPAIEQAAQDANPRVQSAAARALEAIRRRS